MKEKELVVQRSGLTGDLYFQQRIHELIVRYYDSIIYDGSIKLRHNVVLRLYSELCGHMTNEEKGSFVAMFKKLADNNYVYRRQKDKRIGEELVNISNIMEHLLIIFVTKGFRK